MSQRRIKTKRQQTADEMMPRTVIRDVLWHALDFAFGKTEDYRIVFLQTTDKSSCLIGMARPCGRFWVFCAPECECLRADQSKPQFAFLFGELRVKEGDLFELFGRSSWYSIDTDFGFDGEGFLLEALKNAFAAATDGLGDYREKQ